MKVQSKEGEPYKESLKGKKEKSQGVGKTATGKLGETEALAGASRQKKNTEWAE